MKIKSGLLFTIYCLLFFLFSIYSYSQLDLNLTLFKCPLYLSLQKWMIQLGYFARPWSTAIFVVLAILLFTLYSLLFTTLKNRKLQLKNFRCYLLIISLVLIIGYPAFSHDIFNYIFNAKIVWLYRQNPHKQVAAYFVHDVWLRFMHNVHTPAPYAYGWTAISLIPGVLSLTNNLKLSLWSMKLFIGLFWIGQLWILAKIIKKVFPSPEENYRWFLFALNPLVLIETLVVGHNDVVMMFLVLLSFWFLLKVKKMFDKNFLLSSLFLFFSINIKYATIVLLPLYLIKVTACRHPDPDVHRDQDLWRMPVFKQLKRFFTSIQNDIETWAAIFLFLIMFTRPDQLHSWYLIWAFSLAVLSKNKWIVSLFTTLTFGALLRYTPYLYFGNWDSPVYLLRNLIWILSTGFTPAFAYLLTSKKKRKI